MNLIVIHIKQISGGTLWTVVHTGVHCLKCKRTRREKWRDICPWQDNKLRCVCGVAYHVHATVYSYTVCVLLRDCRSVSSWPYLAHPLTCTTVVVHGLTWWQIECMLCPFKSPSLYIVCVLWWKLERGRKEEAGTWRGGGCEGGVGGGEGRGTGEAKSCDSCGLSLPRGEPTLMSWGQRKPRLSLKRTMTWVCSPMLVFIVQNNSFRCEFEFKQDHCGSSVYSDVLCCGVHYSLHSQ